MALPKKLQAFKDHLMMCADRHERLQEMVQIGRELDELSVEERSEETFVPGCMSKVHIKITQKEGQVFLRGFADSLIVRGYVRVLTEGLSGLDKETIVSLDDDIEEFIQETEIGTSALASRANAFGNIFLYIKKQLIKKE